MIKTGIIYETLGSVSNMQVVESKNPNEVRLSGVFGVCGVRNDNHRVYEKANYAKCLEALQTKIANNNCLGELEHPNSFNINLDNVSHIIEAIQMNEDGTVTGTVKLLNTPKGQIAKAIVEGGAPLFISSRAAGSVDSKGNVTLQSIATYDLVGTPGFSQAKLTSENKKFECLNESLENPCWMIVESETPEEGDEIKEEPKEEPKDDISTSTKKEDENNDNNDNNNNKVTMEDLKKSIEDLTQKVTQLEAQLHIAQESFEPVEYDQIENWVREEFAPELRNSINESIAEGVERWVIEEITPKINSWITEEFASNVQSWIVEHFAEAVQNWITEEYSGTVQKWINEEYSGAMQQWITEEYSGTLQKWITEHFAGSIEQWVNEEVTNDCKENIRKWINEEVMPQYKNSITEEINSNLSEYLESKNVSESSSKFASIDKVLEKLSEKAASLTKEDVKKVINETSTSKFKGVFAVENMPLQYRPMFEALDENRQEEIVCSARMYDFTKPNALESFWANQDFNVVKINESANNNVEQNPAANNVIASMRKMLHI